MKYFILLAFAGMMLSNCKTDTSAEQSNRSLTDQSELKLDFDRLAAKLVERSGLGAGERVLLVGMPGRFDPLVEELAQRIPLTGATYLGAMSVNNQQPESWNTEFVAKCFGASSDSLARLFAEVDLGIMLPGATAAHTPYKVLQDILEKDIRRTIHFHWAGAYDLNGNGLELTQEMDSRYQDIVLNTNYTSLGNKQQFFEEAMRDHTIRVTTPAGTDIRFEIGDRPVTRQDGNASARRARQGRNLIDREIEIPAGAIRVAPIEETVTGTIAFPDASWNNTQVVGLNITLDQGKIIQSEAKEGYEAFKTEIDQAAEGSGKSFREFALGMNPLLAIQDDPIPWIPYYGYGSGIVRLSLGDNTELGGNVSGGYVRWNFFTDASVYVGNELWVKDGKLIK